MRLVLLALLLGIPQLAFAQECVTCWADACRDMSGILPRCQAQTTASPAKTSFVSTPPGAEVRVDGRVVCARTPCSVELARGSHVVEMSLAGYESTQVQATTVPGGTVALELAELPTTLWVETAPSGLRISIDGVDAGLAPVGPMPVEPGEHLARIEEACLEGASPPLRIDRGENRSVTITAVRAHATLAVNLPPGHTAEVFVDDQLAGPAPGAFDVDACARSLAVVFPDGGRTALPLALEKNTTQTFDVTPPSNVPAPVTKPTPPPTPVVPAQWPPTSLRLAILLPLASQDVTPEERLAVEDAIRARFAGATRGRDLLVLSREATSRALERSAVRIGNAGCDATCRAALIATVTPSIMITGTIERRGKELVVTLEQDGAPSTRRSFPIVDSSRAADALVGAEALLPTTNPRPPPGAFAPTAFGTRFTWRDAAEFCASLAVDRPLRLATDRELLATTLPSTGAQSWDVWTATSSDDDRCHAMWVSYLPDGRPEVADWAHASIEGTRTEALARCIEAPAEDVLSLEPQPQCATRAAPDVAVRVGVGALEALWGVSLEYRLTALGDALGNATLGTLGISLGTGDRAFAFGATFGPWDNRGGWWGSGYVLWNGRGIFGRDTSSDEVSLGLTGGWDFRPARFLSVRVGAGWHYDPADVAPLGPLSLEVSVGAIGAMADWF